MNKKTFFYFFLCCLAIELVFVVFNQYANIEQKTKNQAVVSKTNDYDMRKALKQAFEEGYFNGRNSYIAQVNDKSYEYTSFVKKYDNLSENQIKMLESENQRGYLEGYHKATAEFSCPIE